MSLRSILQMLLPLVLMGCSSEKSTSKNSPDQALPATLSPFEKAVETASGRSDLFNYRFKDGSCDTRHRSFVSREDMCLSLQLSANNESCAESARKTHFATHCPGQVWSEQTAFDRALSSSGATVRCYFGEGSPSLADVRGGKKYLVEQMSSAPTMVLKHEHASAVIKQSLQDQVYSLSIQIFDEKGTALVARQQVWSKEIPSKLNALSKDSPHVPEVTCYPTLREKK